jgi:hypothetical protein
MKFDTPDLLDDNVVAHDHPIEINETLVARAVSAGPEEVR